MLDQARALLGGDRLELAFLVQVDDLFILDVDNQILRAIAVQIVEAQQHRRFVFARAKPHTVSKVFRRGQLVSAALYSLGHGGNDAQKTMGIITLSLLIGGYIDEFKVPFWVIGLSAGAIALGTALGGWKLIRTLGGKFYKIRPIHSFSTQLTSSFVILSASFLGLPVSTSQVVSSAIIGVGSSERFGKVRWSVAEEIVMAWIITIPASALISAGVYWLIIWIK